MTTCNVCSRYVGHGSEKGGTICSECLSAASGCYDVRCFRRTDKGKLRHGIWVMTQESRGLFVHGDHDSIDAPKWSVSELENGLMSSDAEEVTPAQVLEELANWPAAAREVQRCFDRHKQSS